MFENDKKKDLIKRKMMNHRMSSGFISQGQNSQVMSQLSKRKVKFHKKEIPAFTNPHDTTIQLQKPINFN